jgi:hypothetical protein
MDPDSESGSGSTKSLNPDPQPCEMHTWDNVGAEECHDYDDAP